MRARHLFLALTTAVAAGGCARYTGSAGGEVISPVDAAKTVVLRVDNQNSQSMELRTILNGRSQFIGSVSGGDTTSILLDAWLFPAANLYVVGIPGDARGRAFAGPLAASKGDKINFTIMPVLDQSHAIVVR